MAGKSNVAAACSRTQTSSPNIKVVICYNSETRALPRPVRVDTVHSSMVYQDLCLAEYLGLHDNHAFTPCRGGKKDDGILA